MCGLKNNHNESGEYFFKNLNDNKTSTYQTLHKVAKCRIYSVKLTGGHWTETALVLEFLTQTKTQLIENIVGWEKET
jgi:hypothetical protein